MYLIVGLGNPGAEYEKTRHNLGFRVIDELAQRLKVDKFKTKFSSFIAETKIDEHKLLIAKPQTFMNNSGIAVRGMLEWYKIDPKKMIVIYDDVDLEVGQVRLREKGSAGGHHGIESILASINSSDFIRIRIGIGRPSLSGDVSDYVLSKIPAAETDKINEAIIQAAAAVEMIITRGITFALTFPRNIV